MRKRVICSLLASTWSYAAFADVTIYGSLNASIESVQAKGSGTSELPRLTRIATGTSYIGFKGSEDLGNGLSTIWQIDTNLRNFEQGGVNDQGQTAVLGTRNTFLGLQGAFGKVYAGNSDNAYKALADIRLDPFVNTTADVFGGIFDRGGARLPNSVHYFSPTLGGFRGGVTYSFDERRPIATDGSVQNNYRLSIAGRYEWQALTVGLARDVQGSKLNAAGTTLDYTGRAFGRANISYAFSEGTTIGAAFEQDKRSNYKARDTTQNGWIASVTQSFGRSKVSLLYSALGGLQGAATGQPDDYKSSQWVFGAMYDMSKNTQVYAFATKINNHSRAAINFTGPVDPVFDQKSGSSSATLTPGNCPQSIGIGMRVFF